MSFSLWTWAWFVKLLVKPYWTCQFPHTGVRKGAVMALGQFCSVFHDLLQEAGAEDKTACMFVVSRFFIRHADRVSWLWGEGATVALNSSSPNARTWTHYPLILPLKSTKTATTLTCSRLQDCSAEIVKNDAKNARGLGRDKITAAFPWSCASLFSLRLILRPSFYLRAWNRLLLLPIKFA